MRKFYFLSLLLSLPGLLTAQSLRYSVSMPYTAMSAYSSGQHDAFSFTGNQAALASVENVNLGVYGERRFMLKENSSYAFAAAFPAKRLGNFGVQVNYAGFSGFNENKVGLAYARTLGAKVDVGIQFNYYGYRVQGYSGESAINFEAGALFHLSEIFNAGIHVYSPVGGELGKTGEKLASVYKFGVGYDASESFYISAEIIKEEDRAVNVNGGVQYQFLRQFFARAGFTSETSSLYGGAGIGYRNLRLDLTTSYHPQLGFTPGMLLMTNFKKDSR